MSPEDKKEMADMIADAIGKKNKGTSWFSGLNWFYKGVIGLSAFFLACSTLGTGISYVMDFINHDEIQEVKSYRTKVDKMIQTDSLIIQHVATMSKDVETMKKNNAEGSRFYAVGYRGERLEDGTIRKYYRDWDGIIHPIVPDLTYSTSTYTYWIWHDDEGRKHYTLGQ